MAKPIVELGEPATLSIEDFLELAAAEEEAEREAARAAFGHDGYRLTITIPGAFSPIERYERFEGPLERELGALVIVHGGGTASEEVDGRLEISEVDIGLTVADFDRALPLIRACLRAQGAPQGTVIRRADAAETEYPLEV